MPAGEGARRIGVLGYDDVQGLDIVGPIDVFTTANVLAMQPVPYEVVVLSLSARKSFRTESGLRFVADVSVDVSAPCDTIIIPGGRSLRSQSALRARISAWLVGIAPQTRRIASICTGIYPLAESGLLDGRRATTHWRFAADVAERYPAVDVEPDAIFIKAGALYTSAGVTSGVDLALALVEEDLGPEAALNVARELVVYLKRSGGQMQYSVPLQLQTQATGDLAVIVGWILEHLPDKLSVEVIAERMQQSARHVTRRFLAAFGETPANLVERLRLDSARWRLTSGSATIAEIAQSCGYRSADAFGRAFERRYGIVPTTYRRRFGSLAESLESSWLRIAVPVEQDQGNSRDR